MSRKQNTTKIGGQWAQLTILLVWSNAQTLSGKDPSAYRMDICGYTIKYTDHGNRDSDFGWEIDHINPVANDGGDELSNLQALHWKNNVAKSDTLNWECENI